MAEALFWGLVAGSSLLIGAALAYVFRWSDSAVGLLLGFGAGTLISAVSFELVSDAFELAGGQELWLGLAAGALAFFLGKRRIAGMGEGDDSDAKAIVLGTVLDGIPEGIVLGMSLIGGGGGSAAVIGAVFMSNIPEATSSTNELKSTLGRARMFLMWTAIALATTASALFGYAVFDGASDGVVAFTQAFAGGALLTMLATTMIPESHQKGRDVAGLLTVLGFAVAFALAELG